MANEITTSNLSNNVRQVYNKAFELKFKPKTVFKQFVETKEHQNGVDAQPGTPVVFTRYNLNTASSTPLNEVSANTGRLMSNSTTSVAVEEYGDHMKHSEKIRTINLDANFMKTTTDLLSTLASETTDLLIRKSLDAITDSQLNASVAASEGATTTSNIMTADIFSTAHTTLTRNDAPYKTGLNNYVALVHADVAHDIKKGSASGEFQDVMRYASPGQILNNEIGQFRGFRVVISNLGRVAYTGAAKQAATTVSGAHSAGATVVNLTSATGITAGDYLSIDVASVRYTYYVESVSTNAVTIGKLVNIDGVLQRGVEGLTDQKGLATALAGGETAAEYNRVYTSYFLGANAVAHAQAIAPELRFNMDGSDPYGRLAFAAWYAMEGYGTYAAESSYRIKSGSSITA
jgi:N4-gp56 family major capsid protein